jgi:hypothetical protein
MADGSIEDIVEDFAKARCWKGFKADSHLKIRWDALPRGPLFLRVPFRPTPERLFRLGANEIVTSPQKGLALPPFDALKPPSSGVNDNRTASFSAPMIPLARFSTEGQPKRAKTVRCRRGNTCLPGRGRKSNSHIPSLGIRSDLVRWHKMETSDRIVSELVEYYPTRKYYHGNT